MKLLFLADLHIHFPKKVPREWQRNRYMMLSDEINNVDCDLVVLGGDTLDSTKPTTAELELFFDFLANIKNKGILFSGNHEMQTKKHSILKDLSSEISRSSNFTVAVSGNYNNYFDIVDYPDIQLGSFEIKNKLCLTHVRGTIEPHVKPETDLAKYAEYTLVLAGDLHSNKNSQLNILYPGSPLTTSFHRTRATDANGMYLVDTDTIDYEWLNLSHLPQLIRKTVTDAQDMQPTDYDFTIYELEGSITELAKVENSELLDKKINNIVTKDAVLDLKNKSIETQMHLYLTQIQHLPNSEVERLIQRFNKYAAKVS